LLVEVASVSEILRLAGVAGVSFAILASSMATMGENRSAEFLSRVLGLNKHDVNALSVKCRYVLERGLTKEVCEDFREIRRWVACRAWQLLEEGKARRWRDAIKTAWEEAKRKCMELGVVI